MTCSPWRPSWRADPDLARLADRHYNRQSIGSAQFVPPGRCLVMKSADRHPAGYPAAGWVTSWPFEKYAHHAWAGAWMNSFFRNEGDHLASSLIRAAVAHTRAEWPDVPELGFVTFIDASKVRHKRDPGRCYRKAGWTHVGFTAGGLHAYQQLADGVPPGATADSEPMPAPELIPGGQLPIFDLEAS